MNYDFVSFDEIVIYRGMRFNGFELVHWRKEKKRKRKLQKLNNAIINAAKKKV